MLLIWSAAALLGYYVFARVATAIHIYRQRRAFDCAPAQYQKNSLPLGLDQVWRMIQADKKGCIPEEYQHIFAEEGHRTFITSMLGQEIVQTIEPKNIQAILATKFNDFELGDLRRRTFYSFLGNGIFTSDGKEWEHSRAMLRPQFTRDQVADLELEEKHVKELLSLLPSGVDGWTQEIDLKPLFFRLTLDSATEFLFGQSAHSQRQADGPSDLGHCFDLSTTHLGHRLRLLEFYWLHNPKEFRRSIEITHNFADSCVEEALRRVKNSSGTPSDEKSPRQRYIFLDELAKVTQDPIELRSQLLNILLAGRDTTASLLSWAIWSMARNPEVFQTLRRHVLEDFGPYSTDTEKITFASLKSCVYLNNILRETLRLYPPVPINARRAVRDTTLPLGGGKDGQEPILVRKGQEVGYYICVTQRSEEIWGPDANDFRPERWQGHRPGWDYIPFNGGPRICLGQQFALTEAGYVLTRLAQKYDSITTKDDNVVPYHQLGVTDAPRDCFVSLHEST